MPLPETTAHANDREAQGASFRVAPERSGIVHQVRLCQYDDGRRATLPDQRQIALQAAQAEVLVQGRHKQNPVHVRGQHLCRCGWPCLLADHGRAPWKNAFDDVALVIGW